MQKRSPLIMRDNAGQSLVETALAVPVLALFVFGVVWLICFARNAIALEQMVLEKARLVTVNSSALRVYSPSVHAWGQSTRPLTHQNTIAISHWRSFIRAAGVGTVQKAEGHLSRITCDTLMAGRTHWTAYFLPRLLQTSAETLIEPPLPPNS
jgi:hypothetical protein